MVNSVSRAVWSICVNGTDLFLIMRTTENDGRGERFQGARRGLVCGVNGSQFIRDGSCVWEMVCAEFLAISRCILLRVECVEDMRAAST